MPYPINQIIIIIINRGCSGARVVGAGGQPRQYLHSNKTVWRMYVSVQQVLVIGPDKPIEGLRDVSQTQG